MKFLKTAFVLAAVMSLTACGRVSVPAGNVGIKFDLYGDNKGVTGEKVGPGKYWLTMNEEVFIFPTFSQNYVWTLDNNEGSPNDESITFQDKEGTQINADVGITYAIDPEKVDVIFQKYRKGVDEITDVYLRNMVRDAINIASSNMDVADIYGVKKEELMNVVTDNVKRQVEYLGIRVEKIYWIGAMRLPQNITTAINSKIEATQKAIQTQNEVERTKAEAEKRIIEAKSKADANRLLQASITNELIRLKELEVQKDAVDKWDGKLPATVAGGSVPFLNIK